MFARSKVRVCGHWLAGVADSNPARGMEACLSYVLCCQVEVFATGLYLVQTNSTECGVPECVLETSTTGRPVTTYGCQGIGGGGQEICVKIW